MKEQKQKRARVEKRGEKAIESIEERAHKERMQRGESTKKMGAK